ncbi:MAG: hypothetical protein A3H51_00205 [Candidatus Spechtbacteria bacterium RIFCSPLOWO2_02_FULL_38_8]|uniref:Uncharacterized protein n=1 Tax=Candidatus Spechtbacteria bacterium RIFCSPLOWO2_02_FULL_38_8 TaxID=1802164 RepID=A0A1G2HI67_9BACT|nr:MAG: hypothetical protein A3H51_00205 [Candidatus Spechtbacteria bacterium RIFCSPLOWO2_02_FULL_38_8]
MDANKKNSDKIYSETHYVAEQMWKYYDKKETFGLFLGLIKRKGVTWGYQMLSNMKDYKKRNNEKMPIKIVMAESRKMK